MSEIPIEEVLKFLDLDGRIKVHNTPPNQRGGMLKSIYKMTTLTSIETWEYDEAPK